MKHQNPRFQGEIMTCHLCGWTYKSHPDVESMWTMVALDDHVMLYFCPKCWGVPKHLWPEDEQIAFDNDHPF